MLFKQLLGQVSEWLHDNDVVAKVVGFASGSVHYAIQINLTEWAQSTTLKFIESFGAGIIGTLGALMIKWAWEHYGPKTNSIRNPKN